MDEGKDRLWREISDTSTEELIKRLGDCPDDYTPEAARVMRMILENRGCELPSPPKRAASNSPDTGLGPRTGPHGLTGVLTIVGMQLGLAVVWTLLVAISEGITVSNLTASGAAFLMLMLFLSKHPWFPKLMIVSCGLGVLASVLLCFFDPFSGLIGVAYSALWITYFATSKRVANTFVSDAQRKREFVDL